MKKKINEICLKRNYTIHEIPQYKNNKTKFIIRCNQDNYVWETTYDKLCRAGYGCSVCGNCVATSQEMATIKVNQRCNEMNYSLVEPFTYIGAHKTILKLHCNIDNYEWNVPYYRFVNNKSGCIVCSGSKKKSQIEAEILVNKRCVEMKYFLIEPFIYLGVHKTILKLCCVNDNHEWKTIFKDFINKKHGCLVCSGRNPPNQKDAFNLVMKRCFETGYILINKNFIYIYK